MAGQVAQEQMQQHSRMQYMHIRDWMQHARRHDGRFRRAGVGAELLRRVVRAR